MHMNIYHDVVSGKLMQKMTLKDDD